MNALQGNTAEMHQNALETMECMDLETPERIDTRLQSQAKPLCEIREELNADEKKSWGKASRIRDRWLRMKLGKCNEEDNKPSGEGAAAPSQPPDIGLDTAEEAEDDGIRMQNAKAILLALMDEKANEAQANASKQRPKATAKAKANAEAKKQEAEAKEIAKAEAKARLAEAKATAKAAAEAVKALSKPKAKARAKAKAAPPADTQGADGTPAETKANEQVDTQGAVDTPAETVVPPATLPPATLPPAMASASAELNMLLQPLAPAPCGMTISQIEAAERDPAIDIMNENGKRMTGVVREGYLKKQKTIAIAAHTA